MKPISRGLVSLTVTCLLALAGAGCTAKVKTAYHLQRGNKYFAASQLPQAEIEYLNVLRNDQQNPLAIGRLGLLYTEEGRDQRAAPYLIRGCQLATNDLNLEIKLGMLCLTMGKPGEARDKAEFVLARNPQDEEAPLLLARSSVKPREISAARQQIQKLAQAHDTSALEVGLGTLALDEHDFPSANAAFLRAQSLDPKAAAPFSALGNLYVARNDLKAAESAFKSAAELSPSRSFQQVQYARFEVQIGNPDAAKSLLTKLTTTVPDYVPAWIGLVEISLAAKNLDDAKTCFDSAQARDPQSCEILLLGARLDLALGETTKAIAELDQLAALYPQAASIHYQLALACLAGNETAGAERSLSQAVNLQPEFTDAVLLLAQLRIKDGTPDQAIAPLTQLIVRQPKNVEARMLLADADRAKGDLDGALAIYQEQEKSDPANPKIPLLMGSTYRQQMNNAAARQAFERTLELAPDNSIAAEQLVDLDLSEHRLADCQQLVARLVAQAPGHATPRLLEARLLQVQGETNQAETSLLKAIELEPGAPDAYLLLAQMYVDARQNQRAGSLLGTLLEKDPQNRSALMLLGELRDQEQDYSGAADAYAKLLAINPQCSPALNNLAYLDAEHLNQLDRAYDLAKQARNLLPTDPATADTLGWILSKQGQFPLALSLLQEAASQMPGEPSIQFHLGLTHYLMGETAPAQTALQTAAQSKSEFPDRGECLRCLAVLAIDPETAGPSARNLLEKRLANTPRDLVALSRLAVIYQRTGDADKAAITYNTILTIAPRNPDALAGLAQIESAKDPAKAFDLAKSAAELNPDDQNIASLAGKLAYQSGNYQWAFNYLQPVVQSQSADPVILSDFAHAAYDLGVIPPAQAAMQKVLLAGPASSQAADAQNFLDLIALVDTPAAAVAAESRVQAVLKSQPDYLPALMTLAVIDRQKSNHPAAEETFEKVLTHYPDFSPAKKGLAVLYAEDGTNLPRAKELAIQAGAAFPNDYQLTKALGVIAFRQNNFAEAARLLEASTAGHAGDAELFYDLGISQFHLKHPAQSKDALRHALELKPAGQWAGEATQILAKIK